MEKIIDKHLQEILDSELNRLPGSIESAMAGPKQNPKEEWRIWFPIPSKVTDAEIDDFEQLIGQNLPMSYRRFLQYKHFYELTIGKCWFFAHPVNVWRSELAKEIFEGWPREYLIDKGLIPFASWSDWGLLCFDTSTESEENEYQIVLWDHEQPDYFQMEYSSFESMLSELDQESLD